ncbi:hypothetical protein Q0601_14425 [Paracoccus onubensis]|uniref:hypothetical protein n=1 Tax=Paracoccus onubensis TaxID=1675788 RepID=UPI00272F8064|nr:hypothetical protein [Paracoccus onubensis]MDP0928379.1 hypothetical protein [Paracoccus onubensis]
MSNTVAELAGCAGAGYVLLSPRYDEKAADRDSARNCLHGRCVIGDRAFGAVRFLSPDFPETRNMQARL